MMLERNPVAILNRYWHDVHLLLVCCPTRRCGAAGL